MLRSPALGIALVALTALGCAGEFPGDPAADDELEYPGALAVHPNGRYLYVVNTNADLRFRSYDGGALLVVDLETQAIVPSSTRRIGSFGGRVVLNHDASRGYLVVRGDSTLVWFELGDDGRTPYCPLDSESGSLEQCTIRVPDEPIGLAYARSSRSQPLLDPLGQPVLDENGDPRVVERSFDLLAIAHLRDGLLSFATLGDSSGGQAPSFSLASAAVVDNPSDVVLRDGERFYVTGRSATTVAAARPAIGNDARVLGVYVDAYLPLPTPYSSYEGRALLFGDDGDRLYLTNQAPNALVVYDTSAGDNDTVSGQRNRVIAMFDLPRDPNRMAWVERPGEAPLLYVSSFREGNLSVIDTELGAIVGELVVGKGAFDLAAGPAGSQRVYVSNYSEHTIAVVSTEAPLRPALLGLVSSQRSAP